MRSVDIRELWDLPMYSGSTFILRGMKLKFYPLQFMDGSRAVCTVWGDQILIFDSFDEMVSTVDQLLS